MPSFRAIPGLVAALSVIPAFAGERWRMQYFHDKDDTTFRIVDLKFPTADQGMVVGVIADRGGASEKRAGFVTADGGQTWSPISLPGKPISLFFLNDRVGWLVSEDHIWKTADLGRTWKGGGGFQGVLAVYFMDENRGWACGTKKSIYETQDGGATWKKTPTADEPQTTRDYTVYSSIAFGDAKHGLIAGWSKPPRRLPPGPALDVRPREVPSTGILLDTPDAGATWKVQTVSMFGQITRVRLAPDGRGLGLIEFFDRFQWPSDVFQIKWRTGESVRVFRKEDREVTDFALAPDGPAYIAAIEPPGTMAHGPVPGKLKILRSDNLTDWTEMEVDYRAVARRAFLAAPDATHAWVATDTGMILKLIRD